VKLAADYIDKQLHHIISLSIMQNRFPTSLKFTKLIPLHKKLSKLDRKNYHRPVVLLSPLSKVLEKVVHIQIYDFFHLNKLFHPNHHGYRQNRSTQTALLQMYDKWVRAAAAAQVNGVMLLDLSAAFDLVDSDLLVKKLRIYGVDESSLSWIKSYLTGRYQHWCPTRKQPWYTFLPHLLQLLTLFLDCEIDAYADDSTVGAAGANVLDIGNQLTANCENYC
jgi:hypothetical protein